MASKNIVICCDGTWNSPTQLDGGKPAPTNVCQIYDAIDDEADPATPGAPDTVPQLRWYDEGVGAELGRWGKLVNLLGTLLAFASRSETFKLKLGAMIEGATGMGLAENIREAYIWLSRVYRPGDRIYLFGFSRGAFQVRSLSGMLFHCGLLKPDFSGYAPQLFKLYEKERKRRRHNDTLPSWKRDPELKRLHGLGMFQEDDGFRIHFLGIWDTVAGLGLPMWGWSFELFGIRTKYHDTTLVPIVDHAYHAVAMDEERSSFMPVLLKKPPKWGGKFEQAWFRGAHADVGGGYAGWGAKNVALSQVARDWMMERAQNAGLRLRKPYAPTPWPGADAPLRSEIASRPAYVLAGTWPRMFPVPEEAGAQAPRPLGEWHDSVFERRDRLAKWSERDHLARLGTSPGWELPGPDPREAGWRDLKPGEKSGPITIYAEPIWNPTGLILRAGVPYRFEAKGNWIDLADTSDADGVSSHWLLLKSAGFSPRAWMGWAKRQFDAPWMQLIGMVNHPTDWQRRVIPAYMLLWYLFVKDPDELIERQFPIGKASVFVPKQSGPLYCFANDMWTTYGNNSGSVALTVERLADANASAQPPKTTDRILPVILRPLGVLLAIVAGLLLMLLLLALAYLAITWAQEAANAVGEPLLKAIRAVLAPFLGGTP